MKPPVAPDNRTVAEMRASQERDQRRRDIAVRLAKLMYGDDNIEVDTLGVGASSVDAGYWVQARVFVPAERVESEL